MIGQTLSHFRITDKLGEGGMGEVYRAEDSKLGRQVALKVLPEAFSQDAERMTRFTREAQVLASLNHPNIAGIHQVEEDNGVRFLVMELVEGETLAERIAKGAVPLDEALPMALQIAVALEAAHEQGIVHRDLKPANIKITPEGQIKVLDFGLAKALEEDRTQADAANSPTLTLAATQMGIIIGTAAYMSPEQAAGGVADRRADIWSFGVVLLEMLTGKRQFTGETVSHTLASVLKEEPDWSHLPEDTPAPIVDLLQRCLRKVAKQRLQAIGDARVLLEEYLADPKSFEPRMQAAEHTMEAQPTWKRRLPWAISAALAVGLGLALALFVREILAPEPILRATILPPEGHDWHLDFVRPGPIKMSADGRQLAFTAIEEEGSEYSLWVHPLDSPVARPLAGTEGAHYPFWSPDGRFLAFFADGKLKKVNVGGGPPVSLCDASFGKGGTWSHDGVILFAPEASGTPLRRVSAAGGDCVDVTQLDSEAGEDSHRHPRFLPDGNRFLYLARRSNSENVLRVGALDGTVDEELVETPYNAAFASGRLLFMREGTLMAQIFNPSSLELSGEAVPLVENVLTLPGAAVSVFAASDTGELVYQTGDASEASQLVWVDRQGSQTGTLGEPVDQAAIVLSADGSKAAPTISDEAGPTDIWVFDVARGLRSRFTFDAANDLAVAWSPPADRIAFSSQRDTGVFDLYLKSVGGTGSAELLYASENAKYPYSWSPDGKLVLFDEFTLGKGSAIWAVRVDGEPSPTLLIESEFGERQATISPDGRWLLYSSAESGQREIYVTTYPVPARKWQISTSGGRQARWRDDGKEIIFLSLNREALMSAAVDGSAETFVVGEVQQLFEVSLHLSPGRDWDVTADGQRFLLNTAPERGRLSAQNLVINWPALLGSD